MSKELAESFVELLNSADKADRAALHALCFNRVPCNQSLANHPHVIVDDLHGRYFVGLLGILNGLLLSMGSRLAVAAKFEEKEAGPYEFIGFTTAKVVDGEPEGDDTV